MFLRALSGAVLLFGIMVSAVCADDWQAVKLRGQVQQRVGGEWLPLKRGDVVPDDRLVRTLKNGRVELQRDRESISLGPQTQIQIFDKSGQRFTTVQQHFGEVAVVAQVQNIQHFAVHTPHMAAVVKGTKFVVRSGKDWSNVEVLRGHVQVESQTTHSTTVVSMGQAVTATPTAELQVSGKGNLPPVIGANGKVISKAPEKAGKKGNGAEGAAAKSSRNGGGNGNGNGWAKGAANGGGNGNSQSKGNGPGNGNGGGQGNGAGQGNGNGNGGAQGNGSGSGNGGGNGNGQRNGNGGGNGNGKN